MRQLKIEKTLTNRESRAIKGYFSDISSIPMVTPEEEVELANKIQNGDDVALNKLVNGNLRFVVSVAKQYQNLGLDLEDLVSEGNLGLVKAAKNFDHTKGFKFISYAVWWIRAYITKAIEKKGKIIRLPTHHQQKAKKISQLQSEYLANNGTERNTDEIYEELEMSEKVTSSYEQANLLSRVGSLNMKLTNDTTEEVVNITKDKDAYTPEENLEKKDLFKAIQEAIRNLSSREQFVISNLYNLNGNALYSANTIAQELSVSYNTVIDIRNRALKKLSRFRALKEFKFDF